MYLQNMTWARPPVPARLVASARVPLVGRRNELAAFEEVWTAVAAGARQAVFVGGEPGAGKSRLLAEVATVLAQHDAVVLMGGSAADYGVPYQPFVEMLDHLFAASAPGSLDHLVDGAVELTRLAPDLARHLPGVRVAEEQTGEVRSDLFDAIAALFRSLADERPVVLVFDDLQWAQPPTLALLSHVISATAGARLLVLAAFRTTAPDRSEDLISTIAELYRLEGVRRIDLPGLGTDDIAEYLVRLGGASPAARASAPLLRDQTGGNPFFLRELWRELRQRGGVSAIRSGHVRAPRSVGDTLERRLAGLSPAIREVVEVAAVAGDVFEVATVVAAGGIEPPQVLAAVDAASAIGLIEPAADGAGDYAFVHALSRRAVLDRLTPSRLAGLHARCATALEPRGTEPHVIPRLANHYLRCHILGYGRQAVHYAGEAGRLAEQSLAFEEAAVWFERAAAVPEAEPGRRTELLFAAAANHVAAGRFAQAREIYHELATSGAPETRLAAAMGYEDASFRPGRPGSRQADLLIGALEAAKPAADDPRYIAALASLSRAYTFAGEVAKARQVGSRAIELARTNGDENLLSHALGTSLWYGLAPDQVDLQLQRSMEVAERARAAGDYLMFGYAAQFRAIAGYVQGRPDDLDAGTRDLDRAAAASGHQPFFEYVAGCLKQGRSFLRGDLAGAERQTQELAELGQAFGPDDVEGAYGLQTFMLHRETGRLDQVRHLVSGDEPVRGHWPPALLALYTELGLEHGMRRLLPHVLSMMDEDRTAGTQWPSELVFTTEAALTLGDADALARLQPYLARYAGKNLVTGELVASFGAADRYLGRVAAQRGDDAGAERCFRSALAMDEAMGSVVHAAETLLHHGLHLLTTGDDARAWQLLGRARQIAEPIGQARVLNQIPDMPARVGPDGLSDREVEVLRLLAGGLSNREIGERLYISTNTAANHVRSILMKTGAANRTQAAIYAADNHLV